MSNGDTSRELLLQLNQKLTDFIADSCADRAALKVSISSIEESIRTINHNSTNSDARLTSLETTRTIDTATMNTLKKIGYVGFTIVSVIGGSDIFLHLLHVI